MTPHHRERVLRGQVESEHLVQLFDGTDSLSQGVAEFLHDGWRRTDTLLVVARAAHWAETAAKLDVLGCPVAEAIASGQLSVLDAATTMATFMIDGRPDPAAFEATVGATVARLCARSAAGVSIYGEMVDVLAERAEWLAVEQLETLWNSLGQRYSFRLLCGYAAGHFQDEGTARHLRTICGLHSHASAAESDLLSGWLLADRRSRYHTPG